MKTSFKSTAQTIISALSVITLFVLLGFTFLGGDKIAYVDSAKIMNEYKGAIAAKKAYDLKVRAWQSNLDTLTFDLQSALKKHERDLNKMSPKERELSKQLISSKQKQYSDYQRAIQENASQEDAKLYKEVVTDINAFLLKYGKDHNYKMILIANQSGTIAYAEEGLDISEDVIRELNGDSK